MEESTASATSLAVIGSSWSAVKISRAVSEDSAPNTFSASSPSSSTTRGARSWGMSVSDWNGRSRDMAYLYSGPMP